MFFFTFPLNCLDLIHISFKQRTVLQRGDKSIISRMRFWYLLAPIWLRIVNLNTIWYDSSIHFEGQKGKFCNLLFQNHCKNIVFLQLHITKQANCIVYRVCTKTLSLWLNYYFLLILHWSLVYHGSIVSH